jgi:hypothetical protein
MVPHIAPVAYLAFAVQTLPLQDEILRGLAPEVPVSAAAADANESVVRPIAIPLVRYFDLCVISKCKESGLNDPQLVSSGVQQHLGLLFPKNRRKALLAQ